MYRNAPGFHYVISYMPTHMRLKRSHDQKVRDGMLKSVSVKSTETSFTFEKMSCSTAYLFKIYSANDNGSSASCSELRVAKERFLPDRPSSVEAFFMGRGKGYEIRWSPIPSSAGRKVNYTVSWCPAVQPSHEKCTGPMRSLQFPDSGSSDMAIGLNLTEGVNYHFAVSAHDAQAASSLTWASCVVPLGLKKMDKIQKVNLSPRNATSLLLTWKLPCVGLKVFLPNHL